MRDGDILILRGDEVRSLLGGREAEILEAVCRAYEAHAAGESSLPHSTFLTFPRDERNRIIALPAYLGGQCDVTGIKWIASFPGNIDSGLDRASAVVILNSTSTGIPEAVIEGSVISARRTAAAASLAARWLHSGREPERAGMIGCGLINFETARFLLHIWPGLKRLLVFDLDSDRAEEFKRKCENSFDSLEVEVSGDIEYVLGTCPVTSFATTASKPHIFDLSMCPKGSTILHTSLRDLAPEVILSSDNVVDDIDHVCRARTSIHLAEQMTGSRDFIRCTLGDILNRKAPPRKDDATKTVFSPFGLGVLDLAVSRLVTRMAVEQGKGTSISSFLPAPWNES